MLCCLCNQLHWPIDLPVCHPAQARSCRSHWQTWSGDILGNSRIRISDPWEKSAPTKRFETLFWWDYKYPCPQVKVFFYFQKGLFISRTALVVFSRKSFYFPEVSFSFRELPFCLLEGPISFPEVPFYFS